MNNLLTITTPVTASTSTFIINSLNYDYITTCASPESLIERIVEEKLATKRPSNCCNCGAPLKIGYNHCEYCGSRV